MPITDPYAILFEPVKVGPKTMRNRFYKAPHCTGFGAERPGAQAAIRGIAAEGGWAVVNTESCSIHPSTDEFPLASGRLWDADDAANYRPMVDTAHGHGALVGIELDHGGGHMTNYESRMRIGSVSPINSDFNFFLGCYEFSIAGNSRGTAILCRRGDRAPPVVGFDLINVYGGHAHSLPQQFLDPFYNKRTDRYGGSLENRARLLAGDHREGARGAVGNRCAVVCPHRHRDLPAGRASASAMRCSSSVGPTRSSTCGMCRSAGFSMICTTVAVRRVQLPDAVAAARCVTAPEKPIAGGRPLHRSGPDGVSW